MKLRRAMAVAAATAVIGPALFLSAPSAFADEAPGADQSSPVAAPSDSAGTPDGGQTAPSTPAQSAPAPSTPAEPPTAPSTPAGTPSAPDTTPAASPSESAGTPTTGPSDSASPSTGTSPSTGPSSEPSDEPTSPTDDCPTDEQGVDLDSALSVGIKGLPGKIVAGSGWHTLSLRATNTSDKALGTVEWALYVDNFTESTQDKDLLSTYTQIQFQDDKGNWVSTDADFGNGIYIGETKLGAKDYVDLKLRLNISAKAPAGDGFALGLGSYVDTDQNCWHTTYSDWNFSVLAPGSDNTNPGEPKPGKGDKPDEGSQPTPQGGANPLPATGSLAETGSSSMVPVIGLVGGIAIVAGAGVVFAMKRRRNGATA